MDGWQGRLHILSSWFCWQRCGNLRLRVLPALPWCSDGTGVRWKMTERLARRRMRKILIRGENKKVHTRVVEGSKNLVTATCLFQRGNSEKGSMGTESQCKIDAPSFRALVQQSRLLRFWGSDFRHRKGDPLPSTVSLEGAWESAFTRKGPKMEDSYEMSGRESDNVSVTGV